MSLQQLCKYGWVNIDTSRYFRFEIIQQQIRKKRETLNAECCYLQEMHEEWLFKSEVVALLLACLSILSCLRENAAQGENSAKELFSVVEKGNSHKCRWNWTFNQRCVNSWLPVATRP